MIISDEFRVIAVFGSPVRPTPTPAMLNSVFERRNIPLVCIAFEATDPTAIVSACRELGFAGAAVTIPFKERIVELLDDLDADAAAIGAVNTIVSDGIRMLGYNTDSHGVVQALGGANQLADKRCVVLGAGGAGKAIAFGLHRAGAVVHVLNRSPLRAIRLAQRLQLGGQSGSLNLLPSLEYDVLINATSVGPRGPEDQLVDPSSIIPETDVLDATFDPIETALLHDAAQRGCRTIPGSVMLRHQAVEQLRLWTGITIEANELASL